VVTHVIPPARALQGTVDFGQRSPTRQLQALSSNAKLFATHSEQMTCSARRLVQPVFSSHAQILRRPSLLEHPGRGVMHSQTECTLPTPFIANGFAIMLPLLTV
jgi:hypothetical protein